MPSVISCKRIDLIFKHFDFIGIVENGTTDPQNHFNGDHDFKMTYVFSTDALTQNVSKI